MSAGTTQKRKGRGGDAPRIEDVAKRAGVSPMTVSRVINGASHVRQAARDAVNEAIAALNYAPNRAARSLAGGGQVRLGLLYSNPSAAYLSEFLVGSLDQASRSDVQLVVEKCDRGEGEETSARHLIRSGIDGILLPPPLCDSQPLIDLLAAENVTAVAVATARLADGISTVSIDDFAAAEAMTRHIIAQGHRRIGFIIGNPDQTASERRLEGYKAALAEAGIAIDEALIKQGLFTYRSGLEASETLLDLPQPPTAIFASNDDRGGRRRASPRAGRAGRRQRVRVRRHCARYRDLARAHHRAPADRGDVARRDRDAGRRGQCAAPGQDAGPAPAGARLHLGRARVGRTARGLDWRC